MAARVYVNLPRRLAEHLATPLAGAEVMLWSCGRFDKHGDTTERRVGVWRWENGRVRGVGTVQVPGSSSAA